MVIAIAVHIAVWFAVVLPMSFAAGDSGLFYVIPSSVAYLPVCFLAWAAGAIGSSIHVYVVSLFILGGLQYAWVGYKLGKYVEKRRHG